MVRFSELDSSDSGSRRPSEQMSELQIPDIQEILKQIAAKKESKSAMPLTYLDIAFGIISRLEQNWTEYREHEELRYLRACLLAGHTKMHLPVASAKVVDASTAKMRADVFKQRSQSSLELNGLGIMNVRSSTPPPSVESSRGEVAKVLRKDFQHRGALHRSRYLKTSAALANPVAASEAQKPLARCPWMGPVVPRWPVESLSEDTTKPLEQLITQEFNDWGFNVFALNRRSQGKPLAFAGWEALLRLGAFSEFDLMPESTSRFLVLAEELYSGEVAAPYHNRIHAADVAQTIFVLSSSIGFDPYFDAMDNLALVLAAVIHDVGHDGKGNGFHIDLQDDMSLVYNDKSILENHACSLSFRLLNDPHKGADMLAGLAKEQYRILRKEIVDMVLATDMAHHFAICEKFKDACMRHGKDPERWHSDEDAMFSLRALLLHSADISNLAKPFNLSTQWTTRCLQELFSQGDAERLEGLPISPLCDRRTIDVASSQIGFLGFVVQPTFENLARLVPKVGEVCLSLALRNGEEWAARKKRETGDEDLQHILSSVPRDPDSFSAGADAEAAGGGDVEGGIVEENNMQGRDVTRVDEVDDESALRGRCGCWSSPSAVMSAEVFPVT